MAPATSSLAAVAGDAVVVNTGAMNASAKHFALDDPHEEDLLDDGSDCWPARPSRLWRRGAERDGGAGGRAGGREPCPDEQ